MTSKDIAVDQASESIDKMIDVYIDWFMDRHNLSHEPTGYVEFFEYLTEKFDFEIATMATGHASPFFSWLCISISIFTDGSSKPDMVIPMEFIYYLIKKKREQVPLKSQWQLSASIVRYLKSFARVRFRTLISSNFITDHILADPCMPLCGPW